MVRTLIKDLWEHPLPYVALPNKLYGLVISTARQVLLFYDLKRIIEPLMISSQLSLGPVLYTIATFHFLGRR
jgi:hypothetical protein